jgi:hypothetical protein
MAEYACVTQNTTKIRVTARYFPGKICERFARKPIDADVSHY